MLNKACIIGATLVLYAPSAMAQDLPTTQLQDHGQVVRQDMLTRSVLRQNGNGNANGPSPSKSAATCANARRMEAGGSTDPRLSKLLQLCDQGGY